MQKSAEKYHAGQYRKGAGNIPDSEKEYWPIYTLDVKLPPSLKLRRIAMESILRTLRFTSLVFASKKNLRIANLAA